MFGIVNAPKAHPTVTAPADPAAPAAPPAPTGPSPYRRGFRDALGAPVLLLFASFLGFGSLVHAADLSFFAAFVSTIITFALPGQIVVIELFATGATLAVIALAVALTNVRLLPMTVSLMPHFGAVARWKRYALAHLIAVTGWVQAMSVFAATPPAERFPYYVGFSHALLLSTILGTTIGFGLAGGLPAPVSLGLIMVNPIYFLLMLSRNLAVPAHAWAMGLGAVCGPLFYMVSPDWGLLATGIVAGTAGFLIGARRSVPPHG